MVERVWFGSKLIGEGNGVVRLGPIAAVAEHGIDLCARGERRDTLTNLFDHSREITSGDRQGARAACRGLVGLVPLQFVGDDPCRVDAHQYLPWARMWLWDVFIHEVIGTATAVYTNSFHFLFSSAVDQPKVKTNASTPASRNSISNRRSTMCPDCRISWYSRWSVTVPL